MKDIKSQVVLASLTVKKWTPTRLDKSASEDICLDRKASADAANVRKRLISKETTALVDRISADARNWFANRTLPWSGSVRAIPVAKLAQFQAERDDLVKRFNAAADDVYNNLDGAIREWRQSAGDFFNDSDYDGVSRDRWLMEVDIYPVSDGSHIAVQASSDAIADLKARADQQLAEATATAKRAVHERIGKCLRGLTAGIDKGKVAPQTKRALERLADELPGLDIFGGDELSKISHEIGDLAATNHNQKDRDHSATLAKVEEIENRLGL